MVKDIKIPEDLGVKFGSKVEAEWTKILDAQEAALINSKINEEVAGVLIEIAKKHIAEEKETFK